MRRARFVAPGRWKPPRSSGRAAVWLAALVMVLLAMCALVWWWMPGRPPAADERPFVRDDAGLIGEESEERLEMLLGAALRDIDVETVVATLPSLGERDLSETSAELFEEWAVGDRTRGERGLLLVVAAAEERVRLTVAYELEPYFTDAFVGYIERAQMAPWFAAGMIGEGIEATVELVARQAYEQILGGALDPDGGRVRLGEHRAGGAGAELPVPFEEAAQGGEAAPPEREAGQGPAASTRYAAQSTPELAWERFLEIQQRRIKDTRLGIFSPAAQRLLASRPYTDAGQDHIVELYEGRSFEVRRQEDRAAIVFVPDPNHLLAPWFFRRGPEGWQLDGDMYPDVIGYNHLNQWRFKRRDHPYMFAFADFWLDPNGFATYQGR